MELKKSIVISLGDKKKDVTAKINEAEKEREANTRETLEEAWFKIFGMKNSEADLEKLRIVKKAMEEGEIGREPVKEGKRQKGLTKAEALRLYKYLMDTKREERIKNLVEKLPDNYHLVTNEITFIGMLKLLNEEPIISVDTETTGLDVYEDKIVGISITLPNVDKHYYIPVRHKLGSTQWNQLRPEYVFDKLRPYLEDAQLQKVLHNAKFDIHMFISHGINFKGLAWDTQIAMHLLNENEKFEGGSYALKNLATKYLKEPSDTFSELFGKTRFDDIPLDVALAYAAKDTDLTWRLYQFQLKHMLKLPQVLKVYQKIELPLAEVIISMEREGFIIDGKVAETLAEEYREEIADIKNKLHCHFGDINFGSPVQLSKILFKKLKLDKHLPKNYKLSTDSKTLKLLSPYNEGVALLLAYRDKTKMLSTYLEALPKQVKKDGRVHGSFHQAGTVTGRFSSSDPNLQNQPKGARKLFVAPESMVILSGDFSQQEPRILAHFTQEPALVDAYKQGRDLYAFMASRIYKMPYEQCTGGAPQRKAMKFGVLSVMYGTGSKTLANQLSVSIQEADKFIADFYKEFPRVKAWVQGNEKEAREKGFVTTLCGRKRRLKDAKSRDKYVRLRAERQATNFRVQGSGAEQTKLTMIALYNWCKEQQAKGRYFAVLATIHDEVLCYAPADVTHEEIKEFNEIMVNTFTLKVPNKSDIEIHRSWSLSCVPTEGGFTQSFIAKDKKDKTTYNLPLHSNALACCYAVEKYLKENPHMKIND